MLAVRCALLTVLLAASGTALVLKGCPALGKGFGRFRRAGAAGGWRNRGCCGRRWAAEGGRGR